ncbi:MAG: acetyl-CoA carboxylase biotin carboxyl carrier protein [Gemmatimonadota bacterium]|nr:acetyl-CoA carboxylase biotin carboxyl carrier protein [Gemmatimonadota bacterium]MDE2863756.1 acetyl-CoA carboxylase biotin carboxyl carrier protein [Gemmatimonadota bacterium]MXV94376.1 acetyl-CoA carboxylase biotin carboxyl carrier protein [Gemmatimonadota bacterium]MYB05108.1 acetyl-CoA carboxylase biotin carboxyl carrier protein [Gemmatimonadota bacterium]MYE15072.1 acetyl-CoA carboxylase biotin carboxyl carrier protein [Gemmatimonadota bacterium]
MIDIELLQALVRLVDESSLDSLEIERGATRIRLAKSPSGVAVPQTFPGVASLPAEAAQSAPSPGSEPVSPPQSASAPEPPAANLVEVTSPMVGTFYRAPSPEAEPYVEVGTSVAAGDVLCVIEAMKLMNELECEVAGRIVEICADNAEPVDYGQLLFRVDPA